MSVRLTADPSSWLEIPHAFPTADGELPAQWEDRIVTGMREAWRGAMDAEAEIAVRSALGLARSRVRPEDSITLQYWPSPSIVNAIVHVVASQADPTDLVDPVPIGSGPFAARPIVDVFESPELGTGLETRYLRVYEESGLTLGGVNYFFPAASGFVFVGIDATLPRLIGHALEPLREIVRSIRWVDDGEGPWQRSEMDISRFTSNDETWSFDQDAERVAG